MVYIYGGGGRGNLRIAKPPPPTVDGGEEDSAPYRKRRGAPRRYVLREMEESVLNHRIPKMKPQRRPVWPYRGAFPFLW